MLKKIQFAHFGLITVFISLFVFSSVAQENIGVILDIEIGFDGYIKNGLWTPVRVMAHNQGPDMQGQVRLQTNYLGEIYAQPLKLPAQAQKSVTFFVPARDTEWVVEFVSDGQVRGASRQVARMMSPTGYLIGVVSPNPSLLSFLAGLQTSNTGEPVSVAHINLSDIPHQAEGLSSLDALVLNDIDTTALDNVQREILSTWLQTGGRMVVGGGPNGRLTAAGLAEFLPIHHLTHYTLSSLDQLADFIGEAIPDQGPYIIATSTDIVGEVPLGQDEFPLLIQQNFGLGQVTYFALDFGLAPMNGWSGNLIFWEHVLTPLESQPPFYVAYDGLNRINNSLANIQVAGLPNPSILFAFLCSYIIVLVPMNYFVLKRLKRLERAWLTIPLLIFVFSAVGYVAGFRSRGSTVIMRQISVIQQTVKMAPATLDSFVGLYSPTRDHYTVKFQDRVLTQPTNVDSVKSRSSAPTTTLYAAQTELQNLWTDVGSMATFVSHTQTQPWPVNLNLSLKEQGSQWLVEGLVENRTDQILRHAMLFVGGHGLSLADLTGGSYNISNSLQPIIVQDDMQSLWGEYYYQLEDQELVSRDMIIRAVLWSQHAFGSAQTSWSPKQVETATFVAWVDHLPSEATVAVQNHQVTPDSLNLLVVRMPLTVLATN